MNHYCHGTDDESDDYLCMADLNEDDDEDVLDFADSAAGFTGAVTPADPGEYDISFEDVYGYGNVKKALWKICDVMKHAEKYARLGARMPHGLIMYGRPGVGKTMMAKAFMHETGRTAYVLRKTQGGNAFIQRIGRVFSEAKRNAPSVILMDDMDRYSTGKGYTQEFAAVQAGIDSVQGGDVFVIATVNDMERLPESLLRRGRFDRTIGMSLPDSSEAPEIISRFLKSKCMDNGINTETVARLLDGYTCADLESVLNDASLNAGFAGHDAVCMDDLVSAILADVYEVDETACVPEEQKAETAYHEAGHAASAALLNPGTVVIASVRPGSGGSKGFVCTSGRLDSYERVHQEIICSLAGRAAMEIKDDSKDIGCRDDINGAMKLAKRLIVTCGTSGLRYASQGYREESDGFINGKNEECARMIEECYSEAMDLLKSNWILVESIAQALISRDTLICDDIDAIYADYMASGGMDAPAAVRMT